MRVLADTNILVSALLYPESKPAKALLHAAQCHTLVMTDYNIAELQCVTKSKFPEKQPDIDVLLAELAFDLVVAPLSAQKLISDPKDAPILNAALINEVDIIISGDKHFLQLNLERPKVLTAAEYLELFL